MSSIENIILKYTLGFLWENARSYTAKKLRDGDVTNELCRSMILAELDDIKTKLDGLARKDLLSSVSFLREGLCHLNLLLDEPTGEQQAFAEEVRDMTALVDVSKQLLAACTKDSEFHSDMASKLAKAIATWKGTSKENFETATRKFKDANTKATEAFNNQSLTTKDRILATKLRVLSKVLESLENPEAVSVCKSYLEELHSMPAVQNTFAAFLGKGLMLHLDNRKRKKIVMAVTVLNFVVFDFIKKFTKTPADVWNWPTIEVHQQAYNPVISNSEILKNTAELGIQTPNLYTIASQKSIHTWVSAVNSKGEIIAASTCDRNLMKVTGGGQVELFCRIPQGCCEVQSLAIDGEDSVYIITKRNSFEPFKLSVINALGKMVYQCVLNELDREFGNTVNWLTMAAMEDKHVVIHRDGELLVCESQENSSSKRRVITLQSRYKDARVCVSDEGEIIVAPWDHGHVCVYSDEGALVREFQKAHNSKEDGVAFDHFTKQIIVLSEFKGRFYVSSYSKSGERQRSVQLARGCRAVLTSHPRGPVALVYPEEILHLRKTR